MESFKRNKEAYVTVRNRFLNASDTHTCKICSISWIPNSNSIFLVCKSYSDLNRLMNKEEYFTGNILLILERQLMPRRNLMFHLIWKLKLMRTWTVFRGINKFR